MYQMIKADQVPWYLWPFWAIWRFIAWIVSLTGRLIAVVLGLVMIIIGAILGITVILLPLGIPLITYGFLLILRELF